MNNEAFQKATAEFAVYPPEAAETYIFFGLLAEAGEVADKIAKVARGDKPLDAAEFSEAMDKEMGDILWFISQYCNHTGTTLGALMELNIAKLTSRKERDVIKGSGDDR